MLRYKPGIALALLLLLAVSSCARAGIQAGPGQEFTLASGQSADIVGEGYRIEFVKILADSRCPTGATCITNGKVDCQIEVTRTNPRTPPYLLTVSQPGLTEQPAMTALDGYKLSFSVKPYPVVGQTIPPNDYRLVAVVSKS